MVLFYACIIGSALTEMDTSTIVREIVNSPRDASHNAVNRNICIKKDLK